MISNRGGGTVVESSENSTTTINIASRTPIDGIQGISVVTHPLQISDVTSNQTRSPKKQRKLNVSKFDSRDGGHVGSEFGDSLMLELLESPHVPSKM